MAGFFSGFISSTSSALSGQSSEVSAGETVRGGVSRAGVPDDEAAGESTSSIVMRSADKMDVWFDSSMGLGCTRGKWKRSHGQERIRSEETTVSSRAKPDDDSGRDCRVEEKRGGKDKLQREMEREREQALFKASVAGMVS